MEEKARYYTLHAYFTGMVQGVGFRFFAINRARRYGITGWVKNLYDGRVEILAEGKRPELIMFLEDIRIGTPSGHVSKVIEEWHESSAPRYKSFNVVF